MLEHRKIAKQFIVGITIFTVFLLIGACNRTSTTTVGKQSAVVTEVSLSGVAAGSSIEVGTSRTLSATVKGTDIDSDSNGVNWSVSGGATIVPAGNTVTVTGTSAGDAVVTATSAEDSSKSDSVTLKIVAKAVAPVTTTGGLDISVSPAGSTVVVKSKADGKVISDATGGVLLSDLEVGTYSVASSFTGYDSSTIDLNVIAGQTKSISISLSKVAVAPQPTPSNPTPAAPVAQTKVTAVTADPGSVSLKPGETVTVVATVYGEGSYSDSIRFESADTAVATVDEKTGKVTAVANGVAVIKAISIGTPYIFATTTITVAEPVTPTPPVVTPPVVITTPAPTTPQPAPQPRLNFSTGQELSGTTPVSVTIAETDSELKNVSAYIQAADAGCVNTTFDVTKAEQILDRVANSNALSTQTISYNATFDTSVLQDGSDGSDWMNYSTSAPKYANGSYLVRAISTSYSDLEAYDEVCVEVKNQDFLLMLQFEGNNAESNNITWYGNDDIDVVATPRIFSGESRSVSCIEYSSPKFKNADMTMVAATSNSLESYTNTFAKADNILSTRFDVFCTLVDEDDNYVSDTNKPLYLDNLPPTDANVTVDKDGPGDDCTAVSPTATFGCTFASGITSGSGWFNAVSTFELSGNDGFGVGIDSATSTIDARTFNSTVADAPIKANVSSGADLPDSPQASYLYLIPKVVKDKLGNVATTANPTVKNATTNFSIDKVAPTVKDIVLNGVLKNNKAVSLNGFVHNIAALSAAAGYTGLTTAPVSYTATTAAQKAPITKYDWKLTVDGVDCKVPAGQGPSFAPTAANLVAACEQAGLLKQSGEIVATLTLSDAACNVGATYSARYYFDVTRPSISAGATNPTSPQRPGTVVPYTFVNTDNVAAKDLQLRASDGVSNFILSTVAFSGANKVEQTTFDVPIWEGYTYLVAAVDVFGNVTSTLNPGIVPGTVTLSDQTAPIITTPIDLDPDVVTANQPAKIIVEVVDTGGAASITPSGVDRVMIYKVVQASPRIISYIGDAVLNADGLYELPLPSSSTLWFTAIATDKNGNISPAAALVKLTVQ